MTTKVSIDNATTGELAKASEQTTQTFNVGLLGFKLAVNDSLTVYNLVDGIVDEFQDESGTDESEGSNDLYNATDDYYINSTQPDGQSLSLSAGFTTTSITEPDTSTAGTNPAGGSGTYGTYTVPSGVTSITGFLYGAAGGSYSDRIGGGGGYSTGTLAVTPGQVLEVVVGEGGSGFSNATLGGGGPGNCGISEQGGGASVVLTNCEGFNAIEGCAAKAPQVFLVAGGGGGGGHCGGEPAAGSGGAAGGLTGDAGGTTTEQTAFVGPTCAGGGGDQEQGGQHVPTSGPTPLTSGFLRGGSGSYNPQGHGGGTGGGGYYGGAGGGRLGPGGRGGGGGGGGSSYFGHPQITSGSTEEGQEGQSGGISTPNYVADTGEASAQDGYVLLSACLSATATSTTIISTSFSSTSVPTNSRIVVFEENIDTPTLNTDIIASISRDGGSNYTNATLSDSGYVTGTTGQRILTGQADISGQPSGQSMRWKLALANNQVKIHGVSLSWA